MSGNFELQSILEGCHVTRRGREDMQCNTDNLKDESQVLGLPFTWIIKTGGNIPV
jgi:hypothetical protein